MPKSDVNSILNRMETDLATLRGLLSKPAKRLQIESIQAGSHSLTVQKLVDGMGSRMPVLKPNYTAAEAVKAKKAIDEAFSLGIISYDKRRGMKMVVTKSTEGWSPV